MAKQVEVVPSGFVYDPFVHRLRTPLDTINILGSGGMRFSQVVELWGPPSGGKTTFAYETASNYCEDFPTGRLQILDAEGSVDDLRLEKVFNIPMDRVKIDPAPTIEAMFRAISDELLKCTKEGIPYLGIIDSWTVLNTEADWKSTADAVATNKDLSMYAGGQMLKPRAGRFYLNMLMPMLYRKPASILLINQATTEIHRYGSNIVSGGGFGLKHNVQFQLEFNKVTDAGINLNDNVNKVNHQKTIVNITKSKFIPEMVGITTFIDPSQGGRFIPNLEIIEQAQRHGIVVNKSGWYSVPGMEGSYRFNDLAKNKQLMELFKEKLCRMWRGQFMLVNEYYSEKERRVQASQLQDLAVLAKIVEEQPKIEDKTAEVIEVTKNPEPIGSVENPIPENPKSDGLSKEVNPDITIKLDETPNEK